MAATHTHSAPASLDRLFAKASDEYLEVLKSGIVNAIKRATENLEPAEVGWAQIDVPEHVPQPAVAHETGRDRAESVWRDHGPGFV